MARSSPELLETRAENLLTLGAADVSSDNWLRARPIIRFEAAGGNIQLASTASAPAITCARATHADLMLYDTLTSVILHDRRRRKCVGSQKGQELQMGSGVNLSLTFKNNKLDEDMPCSRQTHAMIMSYQLPQAE